MNFSEQKIQKILKSKAKKKDRDSTIRFIPTAKKVYGVKAKVLNEIIEKIEEPSFDLVEKLWKSRVLRREYFLQRF